MIASSLHRTLILAAILALCAGCSQRQSLRDSFAPTIGGNPVPPWTIPLRANWSGSVEIIRGRAGDDLAMIRKGYVPLGEATFSLWDGESPPTEEEALAAGVARQADVVHLLHMNTEVENRPVVRAVTTMGQSATVSGGGMNRPFTVTTGPTTYLVPANASSVRADYWVHFLRKMSPPVFGALYREATDQEKQRCGRNAAFVVAFVIEGSPAYVHNLLPGDILLGANGRDFTSGEGVKQALVPGATVTFGVYRSGAVIDLTIKLGGAATAVPPAHAPAKEWEPQ